MLHELAHMPMALTTNFFYKFLAALEDEYDALVHSGYAGEGFPSPGHQLDAGVSHDLPPHLARLKALEVAEKRHRANGVLGGSRLRGRRITAGIDLCELGAQVLHVFRLLKIHIGATFRRLLSVESVMRSSVGRVHFPSAKPRERPRKASKTSSTLLTIPPRTVVLSCVHTSR
ncbi:uncharacterized protein BJ212DRAFT_206703 [Suillus subaureus]|uniref:WLM domain-containing protein n=1 Tax=Suillus subaureus TaxID=48587 RepID=A0A9P7EAK0_9AGAM|nr:uncharacterized protein BJ212DRAFT_206703 [Suillus subaureus]KAG1815990.1 hypothetical protein BJ212DRAFT_206703 [Suillus subaureus]